MMPGLQEWIHKIEEGEGARYIRLAFFILALFGLTAVWHLREARNFSTVQAMDAAQIGRNLAQGKGFTTDFVRPVSIVLLQQRRGDGSMLKDPLPDLANAPVYPVVLAGLMKILPFHWEITEPRFWRYQPEVLIGWFNQALFFLALFLVFRLASRLFDHAVGYLAVVLMALTELFWEFTTSGLPTMLLIVLFLGLTHLLVSLEQGATSGAQSKGAILGLAAAVGLLTGIMGLTLYSMLWLIIPVAVFIAFVSGAHRASTTLLCVALFGLVVTPWLVRNYQLSGNPFGLAGYAIHETSTIFPGDTLERSMPRNLKAELNKMDLHEYVRKLFVNGRDILSRDLPEAGGNWILALFLGALLVPYRNPSLVRLKLLVVGTVVLFVMVQALGRTQASESSPGINSENLLVILTPVMFVFGAAFFLTLLDQIELPLPWMRPVSVALSVAVLSLPLIFRLLPPRNSPSVYPPYYPPIIQEVSHWLEPNELMMTDMPWAVSWYGQRQAVWTTLDVGLSTSDDFYRINDEQKAIKGIYLTPLTTNQRFLAEMRQSRPGVWGKFYLDAYVLKNLPTNFPLKIAPPVLLPDQLFLSDRIRWRE